jgi:hypothetical protein
MDNTGPNYSTQFLTVPIQHNMTTKIQEIKADKEERETHKASKNLPHNLNDAQEILSDMYVRLVALKSSIDAYSKTADNVHVVDNINNMIDEIGEHVIKNIPKELDKTLI